MILSIQNNLTFFITTLTLLSNIVFVLIFILIIFENRVKNLIYNFVNKYILELLFVVSVGSLIASLGYSNIMNFPPCELCWIQRIFLYPQTIFSFIGIIKKDKNIVSYLLPLSILGAIVSFYHSLVQWGLGGSLLGCTSTGGECAKVYVLEYGYITIPFMALTAFIYLIAISLIYYKSKDAKKENDQ